MNKIEELKCYIFENDPDIIMITESWGNDTINDSTIQMHGYLLMKRDRKNRVGGGCVKYVKENIVCNMDDDLTFFHNDVESIWCNLITGQRMLFYKEYASVEVGTLRPSGCLKIAQNR